MKKNMVKAALYILVGFVGAFAGISFIAFLYFSSTFLPVYVAGEYILGRQILRYLLYVIALMWTIASISLTNYGIEYLGRKHQHRRRA